MCFKSSQPALLTENPRSRDKNRGLYSLASRLGVDFKGLYPNDLRWKIMAEADFAKKVKVSLRNKMPCRCNYLSNTQYCMLNRKTKQETYSCFECVKELVYNEHRTEMFRFECLHHDSPFAGLKREEWDKSKLRYMVDNAIYFNIIKKEDRSVILDPNNESSEKQELVDKLKHFIKYGNAYDRQGQETPTHYEPVQKLFIEE